MIIQISVVFVQQKTLIMSGKWDIGQVQSGAGFYP
jgi:hypothetical protein